MKPHNLSQYFKMGLSLSLVPKVTYPSTAVVLLIGNVEAAMQQWMTSLILGIQYCHLKEALSNCGPACRSLKC
jgi:hypothetical protein